MVIYTTRKSYLVPLMTKFPDDTIIAESKDVDKMTPSKVSSIGSMILGGGCTQLQIVENNFDIAKNENELILFKLIMNKMGGTIKTIKFNDNNHNKLENNTE